MAVENLGLSGPDGTRLGLTSSEKIGFYGSTPQTRADLSNAAVATTVAISTTTTKWGFASSTQANAIVALVNELRAELVAIGLVGT
jgi:UDP-N-acetyl-D-mannosaminuronic acid transferase (WecB/TagA/CpsF family)